MEATAAPAQSEPVTHAAPAASTAETLFEQHSGWAVALARLITKKQSPESRGRFLPQQFEQAALVALWESAQRYECGRGAFRTFAGIRIRGAVLDELRSCNYFDSRSARQEPLRLFMADDPREDIAAGLRDESLPLPESDVAATLDLFSVITDGQQRTCLYLRYIEGLNVSETAVVMGLYPVRVWNIEQQALRKIRRFNSFFANG